MSVDLKLMASRVANGDAAAFRSIVTHTQGKLYRLACRMMGNLSDAEDVLQDAYLRAYRALVADKYDGRASLYTWLYRIVVNSCLDAKRRRREVAAQPNQREPQFDGNVTAEARVALNELQTWIADLPEDQQAVIVLTFVEGKSGTEIADILDCSVGAVQQRLFRARRALAERRQIHEGQTDDTP